MLVALAEYAKTHDKSSDTIRRLAEHGNLQTAKKPIPLRSAKYASRLPLSPFSLGVAAWILALLEDLIF